MAIKDLKQLEEIAASCESCKLYTGRINPVFAKGSSASEIVLCGMCPGPRENEAGIPFVGDAGKILDQILLKAYDNNSSALDVYTTNIVKCFVKPGISLDKEWISHCIGYFIVQITIIRPKVIIAMGKDVCNYLLNNKLPIGKIRGKTYKYLNKYNLITTYHPSYLARGGGVEHPAFDKVVEDFRLALNYL